MALGGRAAEEIILGKISTGALNDLERITKMAYSIVSVYGMNKNIGNISFFDSKQSDYNFTKPYSDSTAEKIDFEVKKIIENAYERTKNLLVNKKEQLIKIAKQLLQNKVKNIESLNPQVISTGNIGCITQIANGTNIPILHTVELLDWYTGGPEPKILKGI